MRGLTIIPVYNEFDSIASVRDQLQQRTSQCDLLFVDDGSVDGSGEWLDMSGCDVVHHSKNLGYLEALRTGQELAWKEEYQFLVFFDADGQHRVEDLDRLVDYHRSGGPEDLLVGSRYLGGQQAGSQLRHWVGRSYSLLVWATTGQEVTDVTSGLKLLNRRAMAAMRDLVLEDAHAEFFVGMARRGCRIAEIPIAVEARHSGSSMYNLSKTLIYPLRTSFLLLLALLARDPSEKKP